MNKDEFWQEFLQFNHKDSSTKYIECFHFEMREKLANELLALVLCGIKQATASSLDMSSQKICL